MQKKKKINPFARINHWATSKTKFGKQNQTLLQELEKLRMHRSLEGTCEWHKLLLNLLDL